MLRKDIRWVILEQNPNGAFDFDWQILGFVPGMPDNPPDPWRHDPMPPLSVTREVWREEEVYLVAPEDGHDLARCFQNPVEFLFRGKVWSEGKVWYLFERDLFVRDNTEDNDDEDNL